MSGELQLSFVTIKLEGRDFASDLMDNLLSVEVEDALYLPSMFRIELYDANLDYANDTQFAIGKAVEITFATRSHTGSTLTTGELIKGEITSIEPMIPYRGTSTLVIRGYDKTHRLHRGKKTAVFQQVSDSDLFGRIGGASGLAVEATSTTVVHEVVFQDNMTDWEFLCTRARRVGHVVRGAAGKLIVKSLANLLSASPVATLKLIDNVFEFRPRITGEAAFNEVTVRGWDPLNKTAIVGTNASTPRTTTAGTQDGFALGAAAFSSAKWTFTGLSVATQAEAEDMAKAARAEAGAADVQAEALVNGNTGIKAGTLVEFAGAGSRFNGNYFVTQAIHRYDADGYRTELRVAGQSSDTIASLLSTGAGVRTGTTTERHAAIALVTNNNDEEDLGRVKLKYPWLNDSLETGWVRIASPMAGNGRGLMILPEVNDEVLVVFEHGDLNQPIVVGALWNGADAPPLAHADAVDGGNVEQRILKTRAGHTILLKDKSGEEAIHIIDKSTKNKVLIDTASKTITVEAEDKIILKAKNIDITATETINITGKDIATKANATIKEEATSTFDIKGTGVTVESSAALALKANSTVDLKGQGPVTVESSAITQVKGSLVKLN
ncbi:MAG: VgrG-related protein [Dehalococcoidia bacterium]|nr:VgrG-related protein [Dehalococcoidia bacterium]